MGITTIKALKDIPIENGTLPPIKAGSIVQVGSDYAARYISDKLAEEVKDNRRVVTGFPVPEVFKKQKKEETPE